MFLELKEIKLLLLIKIASLIKLI